MKTLGVTIKVWGEWAEGEEDTGVTGAVRESGGLAGDIKWCGAQRSQDIRAARMVWVGEEKLWGVLRTKEGSEGSEEGEEAAWWSWGQQGHWGYWELTAGAQKHLRSKS